MKGIEQFKAMDSMIDYLIHAEKAGVSTNIVHNFSGKEILDSMRNLKTEYDPKFFKRQTYAEFLEDPSGSKLQDLRAKNDADI